MSQTQHVQWDLINKTSKPSGVSLGSSGFFLSGLVESPFGQVGLSSGLVSHFQRLVGSFQVYSL